MKRPPSPSPDLPPLFPRGKKTRELPNVSDCNCCNRRINSTNPKNRLRILTSEWRIILLCKTCYNLVESQQFCSYCLARVSIDSNYFDCKKCRRRIHGECVSKYSDFGNNDVCFDCWIPNLLECEYKRDRVFRSGNNNNKKRKCVEKSSAAVAVGPSEVKEKRRGLEKKANVANFDAERKIVCAMEARKKSTEKAIVAKKAVELAKGALEVVKVDKGCGGEGSVVEEDTRLAIRLHRAMNSSPRRVPRSGCSLNTHSVDVPKLDGLELRTGNESSCLSNKFGAREDGKCNGGSDGGMITYIRKRRGGSDSKCKEEPVCSLMATQDCDRNGDSNGCLRTYIRKRRGCTEIKCKEEPDCSLQVTQDGNCNKDSNGCLMTYMRKRRASTDVNCKDAFRKDDPNCSLVTVQDANCSLVANCKDDPNCSSMAVRKDVSSCSQDGKCNGDSNGCLITYIRKGHISSAANCKDDPNCSLMATQDGKCSGDSEGCSITYFRKGRDSTDANCKEEPECSSMATQDGMCNGDSNGCSITYIRTGRASTDANCKEEPEFALMATQDGKCNGDSNGCSITYMRKGRASTDANCKIDPNCSLMATPDGKCNADSSGCSITYIRKEHASTDANCKNDLSCSLLATQDGKCYGDSNGCSITDVRKGYASTDVKCMEELECSTMEHSSEPSQVEEHNVDAGHCSRTYIRRHSQNNYKILDGGLNLDIENLTPATLLCLEDSRALTNDLEPGPLFP